MSEKYYPSGNAYGVISQLLASDHPALKVNTVMNGAYLPPPNSPKELKKIINNLNHHGKFVTKLKLNTKDMKWDCRSLLFTLDDIIFQDDKEKLFGSLEEDEDPFISDSELNVLPNAKAILAQSVYVHKTSLGGTNFTKLLYYNENPVENECKFKNIAF